jgi:hypothetical protein
VSWYNWGEDIDVEVLEKGEEEEEDDDDEEEEEEEDDEY